ncbi:MAG: hypothetical protein DYH17_15565 [Xanthomonadales bacterium PRO6]|nr:hypothetical protein [Xanthomonadales bacterium]MCE7932777.1 hypothetical protein [Xanthomonadales bacterium PRO6]
MSTELVMPKNVADFFRKEGIEVSEAQPGTAQAKPVEKTLREIDQIWSTAMELVRAGHAPSGAVELAALMRRQLSEVALSVASEAAPPAGS